MQARLPSENRSAVTRTPYRAAMLSAFVWLALACGENSAPGSSGSSTGSGTGSGATTSSGGSAGTGGGTGGLSSGAGGAGGASGGAGGSSGGAAGGTGGTAGSAGSAGSAGTGGTPPAPSGFIIGADISWVQEREADGKVFRDIEPGTGNLVEKDILEILKAHGFNWIRLRLFNDPTAIYADPAVDDDPYSSEGFCDLAHTIQMAQRVKQAGMGFLLDFHYSDVWADPDDQHKPVAWTDLTGAALETAMRDFTRDAIEQLSAAGARPDMVQIGNEIPQGLLWPEGFATGQDFAGLGALLKAGIAGVKEADSSIEIMLHIDRCNDNATTTWWVDGVRGEGVEFDVLGQSCYTEYQGQPSDWQENFDDLLTRYPDLDFAIAEYSWEKRAANDFMRGLPDGRGLGTFIWEPTEYHERVFAPNGDVIEEMISIYDQMVIDYAN